MSADLGRRPAGPRLSFGCERQQWPPTPQAWVSNLKTAKAKPEVKFKLLQGEAKRKARPS